MLQNNRFGNNLANYRNDIPIIDTSVTSDQYFRLFNVPDKLYVGKNSFRMRANMDALVKGSNIYVDIVDSTGKIIYHEFADFIGKDKSRLIVAHIYENTAPGEATIYIAGRTKVDMRNGRQIPYQTNNANSTTHIDYPNIMWIGKVVVVPNEQNNDEVFYITPPIVTTYERKEYYNKLVNPAERIKTLAGVGSQSISLQSVTQGNTYSNTSRYSTKFDENTKQVDLDPKQSGGGVQSNFQSIPLYRELSIIKANGFEFNSDMIGGKITVSGLNELLNIGYDVPPYEFNIVDIVDKTSAKISPNFKLVTKDNDGEKVIDKFSNATDFIISYYSSDVELTSVASESFIQLDIKNLEPAAGNVDSVKISYKPYGSFGSDIDIGTFKINEQNYLVDPSTIIATKNDLVEFPIGDVRNATEFNTYWDLIELKNAVTVDSASIFDKGIQIEHSGVGPEPLNEYDYYFKVKDDYSIQSITDTEYKLQFSIKFGDKVLVDIPQQVDIYISGSSVISDVQKDKLVNPAQRKNEYGQFIGTVSNQGTSKLIDSKVYFKTLDDEQIVPVFMSKNSETIEVKNIIIAPRNELGFTPNMAKLILPVNNFKTDTELTINVDYLTGTNKKADQNTKVYGLQFTGSNAIQNEIDKVKEELETQILIISGSVSDIDLTPLEDAIDDLEDDVYIINNNISIIEGDITNIEGDITTINNDILTITNDITVIFGDIVDINTEIGDIYTEIDTINDLITDIYDDYVPITRELTINGVTFDLSADRSWTIDIDNIYNTDGEIETDRLVYSDLYQITFDTGAFLVGGVIGGNGRLHLWNSPNGAYGYIEQGDGFMDFRNDPALQLFNVDQSGNFYLYNYAGNYANISTSLISTSRTYQLPDADGTIFLKPMGGTGQYVDGTGALQTSVYGTVTSFSAGDLSPLFTTTESTATSTPALTFALSNAAGNTYFGRLTSTGTPSYISAGALTKTDDTNVTLTLGGSHATALLAAMSITVGWTGTLGVARGGSGAGTFTAGYLKANGTSAFTTVGTIPYSDISGTPTIPVALWADKRLAFGQTAAGGLTYDSYIKYDYSTYSFTIGTRSAGTEGLYSAVIGITNLNSDNYTFQIGDQLSNTSGAGNLNIGNNNTGTTSFFSALIGKTLTYTGSYSIIGGLSQSVNGSNNGIFGGYNSVIGSFNLVSGVNHDVTGDRNFVHGYLNTITHTGVTMLSDANYTGTTASTADNQFIGRFGNGYIFKLTASSTAVAINSSGQIVANFVPSSHSSTDIIVRGGGNILSYRTVASLPFTNNTGTVTDVNSGAGMDFTNFTTSGTIILGAGSDITLASTNSVSGTTHAHKLDLGGSAGQYLAGDNTLQTFPTIPTYTAGTGIDLTGNVITNTLPSKWTDVGSNIYRNSNVMIGSTSNPAVRLHIVGSAEMVRIQATNSYISFFDTAGTTRQGYIEMSNGFGFFNITAENSNKIRFFEGSTETVRFTTTGISAGIAGDATQGLDISGTARLRGITSGSDANLVTADNYGVLSYRSVASLGISPSKWTLVGDYLQPNSDYDISTKYVSGTNGFVKLERGTAASSGYISFYPPAGSRIGYIGYATGNMEYSAETGYHKFTSNPVRIVSVAQDEAITKVATFATDNEIKYRTISANVNKDSKSITVPVPAGGGEYYTLFHTTEAITVTSLVCVVAGSSPSIDYVLRYAATRTGTATDIDTSTITVTSTTGTTNTSLENAAVPAGSWIFLRLLNKTGDVTEFHMTINYTK